MLPKDWRQQLQKVYPKRKGQGWVNAGKQIKKHIDAGEDFAAMLCGADIYRRHCASSGEYVRMAQTFFGPNMWWLEFQDDDACENEITIDDTAKESGIERQPGESDDSLKHRVGIAQTQRLYR